jgi:tetratricopeptide (TPR) repeat protein
VAYTKEGDYDRAIQDFDQALLINPRFGFAFGKRSIAYAHKGAYGRSISDWSRWLWLKYGFLGITIRLFIPVLTIRLGFWLKRFRQEVDAQ